MMSPSASRARSTPSYRSSAPSVPHERQQVRADMPNESYSARFARGAREGDPSPTPRNTSAAGGASSSSRSFGGEALVDAAGHRPGAVHALARGDTNDLLPELAQQHALARQLGVRLQHAYDVAGGDVCVEAEQQVGRRQVKEVQRVRLQDLPVVHQPPQLLGRLGQGRAPTTRSSALLAARWWLTGQMPHRRCTITGTSQYGRP
jgi:CBS-domain-containing membrane protein